jgi:hypothetical protein
VTVIDSDEIMPGKERPAGTVSDANNISRLNSYTLIGEDFLHLM